METSSTVMQCTRVRAKRGLTLEEATVGWGDFAGGSGCVCVFCLVLHDFNVNYKSKLLKLKFFG